jgi:hypothetical protein
MKNKFLLEIEFKEDTPKNYIYEENIESIIKDGIEIENNILCDYIKNINIIFFKK